MPTKIEWCEESWNPVTGCTPISEGCRNCYAKRMANRLRGRYGYPKDDPFKITFHPDKLNQPLRWKKPKRIFVVSMGDLFHKDVKYEWIDAIWSRMAKCPQHTFLVLTKRPERMAEFISEVGVFNYDVLPNLWLGVTVESDKYLWRIKELLKIKSAIHFVSCEPLLGHIDFTSMGCLDPLCHLDDTYRHVIKQGMLNPYQIDSLKQPVLDWVIVGGESGPGARPMHPDWVRSIRDQFQAAGVPFFFKQWGNWCPESGGYYDLKNVALFNEEQNGEQPIYLRDLEPDRRDNWDENQPGDTHIYRVGKKKAGRILDGRIWDEYPNA